MEKNITKAKISTIINIVFVVTSLLYVGLTIAYFIAMAYTLTYGNEYEKLGFVFGLIGLPIAVGVLIIPVFRIVTLICAVNMNKKIKTGENAAGLKTATGIMQIADAIVSFFAFNTLCTTIYLFTTDILQGFGILLLILALIPALIKSVLQIISAILLFTIKKQPLENTQI